jgi:predicted amidophosphoribosyltransferase
MEKNLVVDNLFKRINTSTQTVKGRFERWQNVSNVYDVRDEKQFVNKSVLLVDDVLTTGATLEACMQPILNIPGISINVATLAYATQ